VASQIGVGVYIAKWGEGGSQREVHASRAGAQIIVVQQFLQRHGVVASKDYIVLACLCHGKP